MFKNNKNSYQSIVAVFVMFFALLLSESVSANVLPSISSLELIKSSCSSGSEQYEELVQLKNEIIKAESVAQAQEIALAPTNQAIGALKSASAISPFSDDIVKAENRLIDTRSRILVASSQAEVADEFSGMMLAGLDNDRAAHVKVGKVGCDYSSGEMIAIVIGLFLGIIPGLILLVLLC